MMEKRIDDEDYITATFANETKEGQEVEERGLGEETLTGEVEELKRVENIRGDAMDTANDAAVNAIASATGDNKEEEENENSKEEKSKVENNNIEEERSEQNHLSSSLMMDETIDQNRPVSPLMIDEEGEFVGELTLSPPPRSSSPLDTEEVPPFLYLPNRKNRSRTNTNETTSSTANMTSLASSSNLSQSHRSSSESLPSSSFHTNSSTLIDNSAADRNNAFEEEELKSVPNNCAICLSEYVSGDTIVTSCDPMCPHAFHQECIVEWLVKMQVGAPCPCCRRTFVELSPPAAAADADGGTTADGDGNTNNNSVRRTTASPEEVERRREELRRSIQLGIRRGPHGITIGV